MAFFYADAPVLDDSTFNSGVTSAEHPVVVLFWDDTVEVDNMESLAMGLRWLNDGAEARHFYSFYKVLKSASPETWNKYGVGESQIVLLDGDNAADSMIGFHYASEINKWLMLKIDKKTPQVS